MLIACLNVVAAVAVFAVPHDGLYVERLALLVVPTTLAAAVVLAREQTALASQLQRWRRGVLGFTIVALWIAMLIELRDFEEPTPQAASADVRPSSDTVSSSVFLKGVPAWPRLEREETNALRPQR